MPVEFSAGAVMAMLALVLGSQLALAAKVVTDSDLEQRIERHIEAYHERNGPPTQRGGGSN